MSRHWAFVTFELAPATAGGIGVFVAAAVRALARAGDRCTVVSDLSQAQVATAERALVELGIHERVRIVRVAAEGGFAERGERSREALQTLQATDPVDRIEFPDCQGLGAATLEARAAARFPQVRIAVRAHGTMDLIDAAEALGRGDEQVHARERRALSLADEVRVPSRALGEQYRSRYGLRAEQLVVSPPPMEELLEGLSRVERIPDPGHFLFYGRLQPVKGVELLAEAAASVVAEERDVGWRFTFVGADQHCRLHHRATSECIRRQFPRQLRDALEIVPRIDRSMLGELCRTVSAAVIPSRFETFCLAAHELRALGIPLVVPSIPAFTDQLDERTGCRTYDGSAHGLARALRSMREGASQSLSELPPPRYVPFAEGHRPRLVE